MNDEAQIISQTLSDDGETVRVVARLEAGEYAFDCDTQKARRFTAGKWIRLAPKTIRP